MSAPSTTSYRCTLLSEGGMSAIPVPFDPRALFGKARAPVIVEIAGYRYRSTISVMDGEAWIPFRKSHREAAGIAPGPVEVDVTLTLDTAARTVDVPDDLAAALAALPGGQAAWDAMSFTHRREYVEAIIGAKRPETRARRLDLAVAAVKARLAR